MKTLFKILCAVLAVALVGGVFSLMTDIDLDFDLAGGNTGGGGGAGGNGGGGADEDETASPATYALSGGYQFKDFNSIYEPDAEPYEIEINFEYTYQNSVYSADKIVFNRRGDAITVYKDGSSRDIWLGLWCGGKPVLNFGTEPQIVSQEFYDYFLTLAEPIDFVVSGVYTSTFADPPCYDGGLDLCFSAWIDDQWKEYDRIRYEGNDGELYFINTQAPYEDNVWSTGSWRSESVKLDFGASDVSVPFEFYYWIISSFEAESVYNISGSYSVSDGSGFPGTDLSFHVSFDMIVDGESSYYDWVQYDYTNGELYFSNRSTSQRDMVWSTGSWKQYDASIVLDFGTELQEVPKAFYDYIMAAFTPVVETVSLTSVQHDAALAVIETPAPASTGDIELPRVPFSSLNSTASEPATATETNTAAEDIAPIELPGVELAA